MTVWVRNGKLVNGLKVSITNDSLALPWLGHAELTIIWLGRLGIEENLEISPIIWGFTFTLTKRLHSATVLRGLVKWQYKYLISRWMVHIRLWLNRWTGYRMGRPEIWEISGDDGVRWAPREQVYLMLSSTDVYRFWWFTWLPFITRACLMIMFDQQWRWRGIFKC